MDQEKAILKGTEILKDDTSKQKARELSNSMVRSKIDVTAFLSWFIENYPESFRIMKENPDYQERFR